MRERGSERELGEEEEEGEREAKEEQMWFIEAALALSQRQRPESMSA